MSTEDNAAVLDRARAAIGTPHLQDIVDRLSRARTTYYAGTVTEAEVIAAIGDEIAETGDVPDDPTEIGQRVLDARAHGERAAAAVAAVSRAESVAARALHQRHAANLDRGLDVLRDELSEILHHAVEVFAELGDVESADQAVEQDVAAPWRTASRLAGRYDRLRIFHRILVSAAISPTDRPDTIDPAAAHLVDCFGTVRDGERYCELHAYATWTSTGQYIAHTLMAGQPARGRPADPPWLPTSSTTALRFLTRPDVTVWVPTPDQMRAEQRRVADTEPRPDDDDAAWSWAELGRRDPRDLARAHRPMVQPANGWT